MLHTNELIKCTNEGQYEKNKAVYTSSHSNQDREKKVFRQYFFLL